MATTADTVLNTVIRRHRPRRAARVRLCAQGLATIRQMLQVRNLEADLDSNLHVQAVQGPGSDLGYRFRFFQAAGEPQEILQKEVLFNGVKANLGSGLQLPIVESRTSMATPAALTLTERYRYEDGGADGPGRRKIDFRPVDGDTLLFAGSLLVEEATGRILEERSSRSGLPGMVKSEERVLTYGEAAPGFWRVVRTRTFERWVVSGSIVQVQRTHVFSNFLFNGPEFAAHHKAASGSDATMLRSTPDGIRYFNKQKDGTRKIEEKPRSSSRAIGAVLLMDPSLPTKVLPLAGLAYVDFNAFDKGAQVSVLTAIVFTNAQLTFPNVGAGFDFSASGNLSLLPLGESPIRNHQTVSGEAVGRNYGSLGLGLAHDLGAGFRFQAKGDFQYDHFTKPLGGKDWTEGYTLPPSGVTSQATGELSWLGKGFQLAGFYGAGQRSGQGRFTRWGGHAGYDYQLGGMGQWLHFEAGHAGGVGFDRFQSLGVGGTGGDVRVSGIRSNAITADQLTYAKGGVVLPTGPRLRLTVTGFLFADEVSDTMMVRMSPTAAAKKPQLSIREIEAYVRLHPHPAASIRATLMTQLQCRLAEPMTTARVGVPDTRFHVSVASRIGCKPRLSELAPVSPMHNCTASRSVSPS